MHRGAWRATVYVVAESDTIGHTYTRAHVQGDTLRVSVNWVGASGQVSILAPPRALWDAEVRPVLVLLIPTFLALKSGTGGAASTGWMLTKCSLTV